MLNHQVNLPDSAGDFFSPISGSIGLYDAVHSKTVVKYYTQSLNS